MEEREERNRDVPVVKVVAGSVRLQVLATRFRCESITPLGRPVVPLEYGSATSRADRL